MKRKTEIFVVMIAALLILGMAATVYGAQVHEGSGKSGITANSETSRNIKDGNITCDKTGVLYRITGSTTKNHITVKGGSESDPIQVDLSGVSIDLHRNNDGDSIDASPLTIEDGAYAIIYIGKENKNAENTLYGGNESGAGKNWGYAGICVKNSAHATIAGEGKLTVHGGGVEYGGAGIGGNYGEDISNLVIDGNMTIDATGAYSAPGIGSGRDGEVYGLTIKNGNITAQGGKYAPGIGAGDAVGAGDGGSLYSMTVSGGIITATGGESGAGIGGGEGGIIGGLKIKQSQGSNLNITAKGGKYGAGIGSSQKKSGTIDIDLNGGIITATGGQYGAGIGGGNSESAMIDITGKGQITAIGGEQAAGIGAGEGESSTRIDIKGSGDRELKVIAKALSQQGKGYNEAAAIGSGHATGGNINLENARIDVRADGYGAGIGTGKESGIGTGNIEKIFIDNCKITEFGDSKYAPGIGAGYSGSIDEIEIRNSDYKGANIGSSSDPNHLTHANNMKKITIANSTIDAKASGYQKMQAAGIGTGPWGSIDEISITEGSDVTAVSAFGGAGIGTGGWGTSKTIVSYYGGNMGDINISDSTINAKGSSGGAGIGSGFDTSTDHISITGGDVTAVGNKAAGIGSGRASSVDSIEIHGAKVKAIGGENSAGIGCSGSGEEITTVWQTSIGKISIDKNADVEASGGENGAGIGSGWGGQIKSGINIKDSKVNSTGGNHGAGIGGGANGWGGRGGDLDKLSVSGKTKVTAQGGAGAAGIGGGFEGWTSELDFNVTSSSSRDYFVKATGGIGGAGIGSGARTTKADDITIQGGYIVGKGGASEGDYGSGAGIGGGNRMGTLSNLVISGGYIEASAGSSDALDIGHGGAGHLDSKNKDENFKILGGTVIAEKISTQPEIFINGGSVLAKVNKAKTTSGTNVYRATLTLADFQNEKLDALATSKSDYSTKDIYSDGSKKIYLYLPASSADRAWADVTVRKEKRHYHGTVDTSGNSVLKMNGKIGFKPLSEEPVVGEKFTLELDDGNLKAGTKSTFSVTGAASLDSISKNTSPGAKAILLAKSLGEYTVTVEGQSDNDPVYWNTKGTYNGQIVKSQGKIKITENPSKTYDGQTIQDPDVTKNGDGTVSYTYYKGNNAQGTLLSGAPKDAGTYTVVATMADTKVYTKAVSEPLTFTIAKKPVTLGLSAEGSGGSATLKATIMGAIDDSVGQVRFTITRIGTNTTTEKTAKAENKDGVYTAATEFPNVAEDSYKVQATYVSANPDNYDCTHSPSQTYDKKRALRNVAVKDVGDLQYGDPKFSLKASTPLPLTSDEYTYETAYDDYPNLEDGAKVSNTGEVTVQNAGLTMIKVTLKDPTNVYEDAVKYVPVKIKRADLHVKSYAVGQENKEVTSAVYGMISKLSYKLKYNATDFKNEADAKDFTKGHGTLEAVMPNETLGVSDTGYEIGISKVGADFTIGDKSYTDVFVSRNYKLIFENGKIKVTPASLKVKAIDAQGVWHGSEPAYEFTQEGLTPWDNLKNTFKTLPVAILDTSKTGGKTYHNLDVGKYSDGVSVTKGLLKENENGKSNYVVEYLPASLTVNRASAELTLDIASKVYDKKTVTPVVNTVPDYDGGQPEITYYEVVENPLTKKMAAKKLTAAPTDAGTYYGEATLAETKNYESATAQSHFAILKAKPDVEIPNLSDMKYKTGLKLSDQTLPKGWSWNDPETVLSVGHVKELATYTPQDTRNYQSVEEYLEFSVVKNTPGDGSGDSNKDGSGKPNNGNTTKTGDETSGTLVGMILLAVTSGLILCILALRKKKFKN